MYRPSIPVIALAALLAAAPAVSACVQPQYSSSQMQAVPTSGIDQALFSDAIAREASYQRCKRGKRKLAVAPKITGIAARHSQWMAKAGKLTHVSTVPGKRRLGARVRSTRLPFLTASENIASLSRFQFSEQKFSINDSSGCRFSYNGIPIPRHTYASLARRVVELWMNSSGHRRNLLKSGNRLVGGGVGFDAKAPYCGQFFVTQTYMG